MTIEQMKSRAVLEIERTARSMFRHIYNGNTNSAMTVNTGLLMMIINYTAIGLLTTKECNDICDNVEREFKKEEF